MSEVSFRGIEKRFDAQSLALRSLDLDVPDGAFLVLLGPSGCGKTTALRVLAGLETPTAGTVHIGDRDVTRIQPRDRDVAMVFQSYALYPHMTVGENIGYPLRIRGLSKADQRAGVQRVAESLEIAHLLDRRQEPGDALEDRRLAAARGPEQHEAVAAIDVEAHPPGRRHQVLARLVLERDVLQLQHLLVRALLSGGHGGIRHELTSPARRGSRGSTCPSTRRASPWRCRFAP